MRQFIATILSTLAITIAAQAPSPKSELIFHSSDATMQKAFDWAKSTALSYSHVDGDPVGPWCEAALPDREAFCIRDVAHQSVGAHILGLTVQNMNMMTKFVDNIAPERDWCTYWELDRHDRPAPIDYRSDKEFWYNLNANFDIIVTAWKLYNWTADDRYVTADNFTHFYTLSLNQYLDSWQLRPESIMSRPRYMNRASEITPDNQFYHCRGIPSYVENFPGICVGLDLLGTIYAGHIAAAGISTLNPSLPTAEYLQEQAAAYRRLMEKEWWDDANRRYHTFYTENGEFASGEGIPFALWFGIVTPGSRQDDCIRAILSREWNIENLSYFPALLIDLGYPDKARELISQLPTMPRSEYPEVSFAMIEALVRSAMGLRPNAVSRSLTTEYRLGDYMTDLTAENIPLYDGSINITHDGNKSTTLTNNTRRPLHWTPVFNSVAAKTITLKPGTTKTVKNKNSRK